MPIYEYNCEKCGAKFEIIRGITANQEAVKCPKCGAVDTKKLFSSVCCGSSTNLSKGNLRFPT